MDKNRWLDWAKELQDLSQNALAYCKDIYDIERFRRIREISAEMAAELGEMPVEAIRASFLAGDGYQTPKQDTRAAVFRAGKLLLVREATGLWALPGGWVDYNQTLRTNAAKEVLEEAGMVVRPLLVIALHDHNSRNTRQFLFNICSAFILCEYVSGEFMPNLETVGCGFFGPDEIPAPLAENKTTAAQIAMCFRAAADENWNVEFD